MRGRPTYGPRVPGPSALGSGVWPSKDFRSLDPATRAACEFLQDVVVALQSRLVEADLAHRHSTGLTRSDLARRAGVSSMSVTEFLAGRTFPRADTLLKICHTAGVNVGVL